MIACTNSLVSTTITVANNANAQYSDRMMNNDAANQEKFSSMFRNMMSVNVPMFYDMFKNGSSMGINVLSGLVKVERGQEAERSGLVGPRPLSVRIFGVPVYERGQRIRDLNSFSPIPSNNGKDPIPNKPVDDEELPIIT